MTKRHITEKIRQKVVETFRISDDDESRKGKPTFGYFISWIIGILFFLFWFFVMLGRRGGQIGKIELWFVANIIEGYVEPFLEAYVVPFCGGGIFVVAASIGLVVGFVFVVRDWKRERRRRRH